MYKRIMIVVDPRPVTRAAVKEGTAMARTHGAEALFFHVLPRYPILMADVPALGAAAPEAFEAAAKDNARRLLAEASAVADKQGVAWRTGMGSGVEDARCIVDAARRRRCDLIVVASEGRNALVRLLTGSVIPGLITLSPVPVLVCKKVQQRKAGAAVALTPPKPRRTAQRAAVSMR